MSTRYYGAVWVDYLHDFYEGKLALNVVETDAKGHPLRHAHRIHIDGPTPPSEAEIIALVLPGAIRPSTST